MSTAVTVENLRTRFPRPVPSAQTVTRGYSVGGTLIMWLMGAKDVAYVDERFRFPDPRELSFHLIIANTSLSKAQARKRARAIVNLGSRNYYQKAWEELDRALKFQGSGGVRYQ